MSHSKNYTIWCDRKKCNNNFIGTNSLKATRKLAKEKGWIHTYKKFHWIDKNEKDICPKCIQAE